MSCDSAAFVAAFPELDFASTANAPAGSAARATALISVKLAQAVATVDRTQYPSEALADLATLYLAAHLMVSSPSGLAAKLAASDFRGTLYGAAYRDLARGAVAGGRVP
jgi:hypothetical protein